MQIRSISCSLDCHQPTLRSLFAHFNLFDHSKMGTRGLIGHVIAGKKKGTYNGHDSYPSWLGVAIVQFIKSLSAENIKTMKEHLEEITW